MDFVVHAITQNSTSTEVRHCATRTDVENFIIGKLRSCFETGENVVFHVQQGAS